MELKDIKNKIHPMAVYTHAVDDLLCGCDGGFSSVSSDTIITATYTINSYTVTFVDYDGTELDIQQVDYRNATQAPTSPTREGYDFTGWDSELVVRFVLKNVNDGVMRSLMLWTIFADAQKE